MDELTSMCEEDHGDIGPIGWQGEWDDPCPVCTLLTRQRRLEEVLDTCDETDASSWWREQKAAALEDRPPKEVPQKGSK